MNGEIRHVGDELSLAGLLESLGVGHRRVAVELNRDIIPRDRFATTRLAAGDVVEVVQFVGGG